jgi:hypothetical protein
MAASTDETSAARATPDAEQAPAAAMESAGPEAADTVEAAATTAAAGEAPKSAPADSEATAGGTDTTAGGSGTYSTSMPSYEQAADLQALATAREVILADGVEAPCAERASGELVADGVLYAGTPAAVYRDAGNHTLTAWAVGSCARLADYVYAGE